MVVKTQQNGSEVTGLQVGAANVRRYFSKGVSAVELRLDGLTIECTLRPDFWRGKPEIHDPRLTLWLQFRKLQEPADRKPISLDMVQSGTNTFTLHSIASRR